MNDEFLKKLQQQIQSDLDRLAFGGDTRTSTNKTPTILTRKMLDDLIAKFPVPEKVSIHVSDADMFKGKIIQIHANGERQFWMDGSKWAELQSQIVTYNAVSFWGYGAPVYDHRKTIDAADGSIAAMVTDGA